MLKQSIIEENEEFYTFIPKEQLFYFLDIIATGI